MGETHFKIAVRSSEISFELFFYSVRQAAHTKQQAKLHLCVFALWVL